MTVAPRATGKLTLTVHEGKELTNKDIGKQDPFVKLKLADQSHKTKTHKKGGSDPKWKETFHFDIKDYDLKETLHVEAWDEDALSNDKIGRILIPLDTLVQEASGKDGYWFQLRVWDDHREIAGYIRLSVVAEGKGFPGEKTAKEETATVKEAIHEKLLERLEAQLQEEKAHVKSEPKSEPKSESHVDKKETKKLGVHEVRFQAKHSELFLNVWGGSKDDGGHIIQWKDEKGGPNETFIVTHHLDGTLEIIGKGSGKALTPESDADLAKLVQKTDTDSPAQRWQLRHHDDGSFSIINVKSGRAVDIPESKKDPGVNVILSTYHGTDNQRFFAHPSFHSHHGKSLAIIAQCSGLVLDVYGGSVGNGAAIIQWKDGGADNQRWVFHRHEGFTYHITSKKSGKYLTASGTANGSQVTQEDKSDKDDQLWLVVPESDGSAIINKAAHRYLNVTGSSKEGGAKIIVWDRTGESNEKFRLE